MDVGFDPLSLATTESPFGGAGKPEDTYYNYREAEVKHGRLAMLATLGWLTSEEFGPAIARQLGLQDLLAPGELAPSLVNGGLGNLPVWFLPGVAAISGLVEWSQQRKEGDGDVLKVEYNRERLPGDLGFDPLNLRAASEEQGYSLVHMHNAEVKHGRAAMLAITAFVLQEFFSKVPVVAEDEITADRVVSAIDRGIDALDAASGLNVPEIPIPFPSP